MKSVLATSLVAGAVMANKAPTRIEARSTSICGQWDSVPTGVYTIYQDLWNMDAGTGSQCTTVESMADDVLSWSTSWSWTGGTSEVKSFANAVTNYTITTLSAISSIPSIWSWTYTGDDIVADVAYDMFTSSSAGGTDEYEIMIWLDALGGAGPISSSGSAVATPEIAGTTWSLYDGYNGDTHVFSFVASSAVSDFNGDLYDFFTYLIENESMSSSQYLLSIGAGSEPFTGTSAVFSVASYSCGVSTGSAAATSASAASSAVASTSAAQTNTSSAATVASSATGGATPVATSAATTFYTATKQASSFPNARPSQASFSRGGGGFPSHPASHVSTTAAPVTTAAPASAETPATTLATSTKKSCNKKRSQ